MCANEDDWNIFLIARAFCACLNVLVWRGHACVRVCACVCVYVCVCVCCVVWNSR